MKKLFPALLALLLWPATAPAFVSAVDAAGRTLYWNFLTNTPGLSTNVYNTNTHAIRYHLASDGFSTANKTAELNALRACFAQWQSVPGTIIKFEDAGLVAPYVDMLKPGDGTNVVYWEKKTNFVNGGSVMIGPGVLGYCAYSYDSSGRMLGSDILLNGTNYNWFTDFNDQANTNQFIESTALHEIGHWLGLEHSPVGGATMLASGRDGVDAVAGLSTDDVSFARAVYPQTNFLATLGHLSGQVTMSSTGFLGAAVFVEGTNGNMIAGTITRSNGLFQIPSLPVGSHRIRVCPLDPRNSNPYLVRGQDISALYNFAATGFKATTNFPVTVTAGVTNTINFAVSNVAPAFRITYIREPVSDAMEYSIISLPVTMHPGQSNFTIGVFSATLPTNGATFSVSGDGITLGAPSYDPSGSVFVGLNGISATISIASNATPGLRTLLVAKGTTNAYANGFLEILPLVPDNNFDGLDDRFQRQFFPLFTATNAAPAADPDGDTMTNQAEFTAGTNPTNAASLLKLQSTVQSTNGTTIFWQSVIGKKYQVSSRLQFTNTAWANIGTNVIATNTLAQYKDTTATNGQRFYRVQALP